MRENSAKEVAIGLSFASDWSREKEREAQLLLMNGRNLL